MHSKYFSHDGRSATLSFAALVRLIRPYLSDVELAKLHATHITAKREIRDHYYGDFIPLNTISTLIWDLYLNRNDTNLGEVTRELRDDIADMDRRYRIDLRDPKEKEKRTDTARRAQVNKIVEQYRKLNRQVE